MWNLFDNSCRCNCVVGISLFLKYFGVFSKILIYVCVVVEIVFYSGVGCLCIKWFIFEVLKELVWSIERVKI